MNDIFKFEQRKQTEQEKRQQLEREQLARSYKKIFDNPDGKLVLLDLMRICHIFTQTFNANNSKIQDFMEGERYIGNYIIKQSQIEMGYIDELRKELKKESTERGT